MDLRTALRIVRTPLLLPGLSDDALVDQVRPLATPGHRDLWPVPELHGESRVRAADVLLSLASATRPQYEADVYDVHRQWALLRYLGVFDEVGAGPARLGLSEAGRRTVLNQRRILSEDLGVGFATLLSARWQLPGADAGAGFVQLADVDTVLSYRGYGPSVTQVGSQRPDYLVVAHGPASRTSIGLLECKGTSGRGYSLRQLATASEQLAGLLVDGSRVPGLAISTKVANNMIRYRAVQKLPHLHPYDHEVADVSLQSAGLPSSPERVAPIGQIPTFDSPSDEGFWSGFGQAGVAALAPRALAASWRSLAELCANEEAAQRWGPRERDDQRVRAVRPRGIYQAPDGRPVRGVANVIDLPGGRLEVVLGAMVEVDDALASGNSTEILRAQTLANARRPLIATDDRKQLTTEADGEAAAYGGDGAALLLRPLAD